jgi:hypothetical protein
MEVMIMYDLEEALMVIREWERYTDDEYKEAINSLFELLVKEAGLERELSFR